MFHKARIFRVAVLIARVAIVAFVLILVYNIVVWRLLRDDSVSGVEIKKQGELYNPYGRPGSWYKASFHLHSDAYAATPERHSPALIAASYRSRGFDILALSDYNQITGDSGHAFSLPAFEWGQNIRKRHVLVVGATGVLPDFFPLFSSTENLQWSLHRLREDGSFVSINHPRLFGAFSDQELIRLQGYQAVEVFSPFGDSLDLYDTILTSGRVVFPLASDDLHYLPATALASVREPWYKIVLRWFYGLYDQENEAFQRYDYVYARSTSPADVLDALCHGSFMAVHQFVSGFGKPPVRSVGIREGRVSIELPFHVSRIEFIGPGGRVLHAVANADRADMKVEDVPAYVRIQVTDMRGVMLTSPFFRHDGSGRNGLCRPAVGVVPGK